MADEHKAVMSAGSGSFPTTHWSTLAAARGRMSPEQREVLNCLILRYWKPVHTYIYCHGFQQEAADLTQDFFVGCLRRELFGRAERARGRFRAFLLSCLRNFLADARRHQQRHGPPQGVISVQQLIRQDELTFQPAENETPDAVFYRTWVRELLTRVWQMLEQEYRAAGREVHCELFRQRVFEPALNGTPPAPLLDLAQKVGLTERQASNCVTTTVRAFRRILRQEVGVYAGSEEEVNSEIRDLFRLASGP